MYSTTILSQYVRARIPSPGWERVRVKGNLEVVTASGKRSVYTPQLSEEPTLLHEEQR